MSVSEHAAATLVAATGWIALSCAKKKKAIIETLTAHAPNRAASD